MFRVFPLPEDQYREASRRMALEQSKRNVDEVRKNLVRLEKLEQQHQTCLTGLPASLFPAATKANCLRLETELDNFRLMAFGPTKK